MQKPKESRASAVLKKTEAKAEEVEAAVKEEIHKRDEEEAKDKKEKKMKKEKKHRDDKGREKEKKGKKDEKEKKKKKHRREEDVDAPEPKRQKAADTAPCTPRVAGMAPQPPSRGLPSAPQTPIGSGGLTQPPSRGTSGTCLLQTPRTGTPHASVVVPPVSCMPRAASATPVPQPSTPPEAFEVPPAPTTPPDAWVKAMGRAAERTAIPLVAFPVQLEQPVGRQDEVPTPSKAPCLESKQPPTSMPLKAAYTSVALDSLGAATGDAAEEVGTCPAAPSSSRTSIQEDVQSPCAAPPKPSSAPTTVKDVRSDVVQAHPPVLAPQPRPSSAPARVPQQPSQKVQCSTTSRDAPATDEAAETCHKRGFAPMASTSSPKRQQGETEMAEESEDVELKLKVLIRLQQIKEKEREEAARKAQESSRAPKAPPIRGSAAGSIRIRGTAGKAASTQHRPIRGSAGRALAAQPTAASVEELRRRFDGLVHRSGTRCSDDAEAHEVFSELYELAEMDLYLTGDDDEPDESKKTWNLEDMRDDLVALQTRLEASLRAL